MTDKVIANLNKIRKTKFPNAAGVMQSETN